jgi:hypothetical protein
MSPFLLGTRSFEKSTGQENKQGTNSNETKEGRKVHAPFEFERGRVIEYCSCPEQHSTQATPSTGRLDLHTKKAVQVNKVIASLIGQQVTKTFKEGKPGAHSRTTEVYRTKPLPNNFAQGC